MIELINNRGLHHKEFDLGNGQIKRIVQRGLHYKDPSTDLFEEYNGKWVNEPGFGQKVKTAQHNLRCFNNKLRFGFDHGVFIDYTLPVTPQSNSFVEDKLYLSDVWYNTDLEYKVFPEGIKADIILKQNNHPSSFSFPINATNCIFIIENNNLVFYNKGNVVGRIPAPYMIDANNDMGAVTLTLNGSNVVFTPDTEFLQTAVYPIKIDPTTTIQPNSVGKDTYINGGTSSVNTNFGTSTQSSLGYLASGYQVLRTLQQYDYTGISGTINSAYFKYYVYQVAYLDTSRFVEMHYINASWDEITVTWNNKPTTTLYAQQTFKIGASVGWKTIDNTSMVSEFVKGTKPNYGFMLKGSNDDAGTSNQLDRYYSSDEATNVTLRPYQEIIYTPVAANNLPFQVIFFR